MDVIVITYNRKDILTNTLNILRRYNNFRIILVHHGLFSLKGLKYDIEVLSSNGYAKCINDGMKISESDWVLIMNDDVILYGYNWNDVEKDLYNKDVYFAGFRLLFSNGSFHPSVGKHPPTFLSLLREELRLMSIAGIISSREEKQRHRGTFYPMYLHKIEGYIGHTIGALFAVKRDCFMKVNGMDERYRLFYEESDLWKKFQKKGWRGYYFPEYKAYHIHSASHKGKMEDIFYDSMVKYVKKWYGKNEGDILKWIIEIRRKIKK